MQLIQEYLLLYHSESITFSFNAFISQAVFHFNQTSSANASYQLAKAKAIQGLVLFVKIKLKPFLFAQYYPKYANLIFESRHGFKELENIIKTALVSILDKKIEQFDFRQLTTGDAMTDRSVFEDWNDLDANVLTADANTELADILSWVCMEQLDLQLQIENFSIKQLLGDFQVQSKHAPTPLEGTLKPFVENIQSLQEFKGIVLAIGPNQTRLLYQGFECHNTKCRSHYLTTSQLFWIDLKITPLSKLCPDCSTELNEVIAARRFSSFNSVIVLAEAKNKLDKIYRLIIPTALLESYSLSIGNWISFMGYNHGIFKADVCGQSTDESFVLLDPKGPSYPLVKSDINIYPVVAVHKYAFFRSLMTDSISYSGVPALQAFQHRLCHWIDAFSFGLSAAAFAPSFRLALIICIVSAMTTNMGKPLHLLLFHQEQDFFTKFIISKLCTLFWNVPWSTTEPSNINILHTLEKRISAIEKTQKNNSLHLELARNSIFLIHSPLFKSKRQPLDDFGQLISIHCPCSVIGHSDIPRHHINTRTDSSVSTILSAFDILLEVTGGMASRQTIATELLDLSQHPFDASYCFFLLTSLSSLVFPDNVFSVEWTEESKNLIRNYFLASRSSSPKTHVKEEFDFVFPELSTSQVEVKPVNVSSPKQTHLGYESPTSIIERIVRLSIVISLLSFPFSKSNAILIGKEEVILRYTFHSLS